VNKKIITQTRTIKNPMRKHTIILVSFLIAVSFSSPLLHAQDQLWQSFTNMRTARGYHNPGAGSFIFSRLLISSPQGIWAATTGGVLLWDANRKAFRQSTNTDGLRQNITKAIGRDNRGRIWVFLATGTIAQPAGLIDVFDPASNSFTRVDDYLNRNIYDFSSRGDSMYLALDRGISLYDISRNEVKETYQNLGPRFPRGTAVNSLFFDGRDLWAATGIGIARTSLDLPNLLAPESWTNYNRQEGLPSDKIHGFAKFSQRIIAGTANGAATFDGQRWTSAGLPNTNVLQLLTAQENGKAVLYAATPSGIFRAETLGAWSLVGSAFSHITGIAFDETGALWASTYNNGLYEFDRSSQNWRLHEPDGPTANSFASLSLDQDGNLWCTSASEGFQIYDGARWYNYNTSKIDIGTNDVRHIVHLANGEHWVGTWGSGISVLDGPLYALRIKRRINAQTGEIATALGETNYPVVPFLITDAQNNIWILNFNAANTNALLTRTPADQFVYFSTSDGLRSIDVAVMEIDEREEATDRVWVGTFSSGVSVFEYDGVVQNKTDVNYSGELDLDDNLLSNRVTSIAQDRDGYIWIGTDKGLNYFFGSGGVNDRFCYSLINDDVKVVKVDPRNNKWVGTSAGITVLSGEDNCSTTEYTVENSPLVGNFVASIVFNTQTGDAWIGTTTGLSRFRTPFTEPKPDLSQLSGYPNPYMLDETTAICGTPGGFRITNLAEESAVKIYTINGELVRNFATEQVPGAQVCWDGRDDSGDMVPSGVYLFVAFVKSTGASAVGKVAVVRR
jgi:ligand-binding sensor domain-containing protein